MVLTLLVLMISHGYSQDTESDFIVFLVKKYMETFKKMPNLKEEHFLLECAWFARKKPDLQYVSIAPNINNPHSPYENVSISSMKMIWKYVKEITKDIDKEKDIKKDFYNIER